MSVMRKFAAAAAGSLMLVGAVGVPAEAQVQDGLVNVAIGDVTILEDVRVALAANVVANVCGVSVNVLSVDQTGVPVFCTARSGRAVAVTDN